MLNAYVIPDLRAGVLVNGGLYEHIVPCHSYNIATSRIVQKKWLEILYPNKGRNIKFIWNSALKKQPVSLLWEPKALR